MQYLTIFRGPQRNLTHDEVHVHYLGQVGDLLLGLVRGIGNVLDRRAAVVEYAAEPLLWIAAGLTLITGYDYLRTGLRHMAEDTPPGAAE